MNHILYETEDVGVNQRLCDNNGKVVIAQCRLCTGAENELGLHPLGNGGKVLGISLKGKIIGCYKMMRK